MYRYFLSAPSHPKPQRKSFLSSVQEGRDRISFLFHHPEDRPEHPFFSRSDIPSLFALLVQGEKERKSERRAAVRLLQ